MSGARCRRWASIALLAAAIGACSGGGSAARSRQVGPLAQGVVAHVDGTEISLADVEQLAERGALSPKEALARLEAEALLAAEAERRGYAELAEVGRVAEQARVQALLAGDIDAVVPTEAEIDAAYAANQARFHTPEQRAATHLLAVLPKQATPEQDQAARAFIAEAVRRLRAAGDPLLAVREFKQASPESARVGLETKVEVLPPVPQTGRFVKEFSEAMFKLEKPGSVSDPVRTQYGWHAIVLREIVPPHDVPEVTAREDLRAELTLQKRQKRFDELVRSLLSRTRVTYGTDVKSALATLEF